MTKTLSFSEFKNKLKNVYQFTGLFVDRFVIICPTPKISKSIKVYANRIASRQSTEKITFLVTNVTTGRLANFWCWPNDKTTLKLAAFERYYCEDLQSLENILYKTNLTIMIK